METILWRSIVAACAVALCPALVLAQTDPRPPAHAVFEQTPSIATSRDTLNVTMDLGQAYDQNLLVQSEQTALSLFQGSGLYTVFAPSVDFASAGERVKLVANVSSNARYYSEVQQTIMTNESAGFGLSARLSQGTTLNFNQGVTHAATLLSGLFTPAAAPVTGDNAASSSNNSLNTVRSYGYATTAGLSQQLSPRASLQLTSNIQYTFMAPGSGFPDLRSRDAGGTFNYSLSRNLTMRLGYAFRQGDYTGSPSSQEHDLNFGFAYTKPLSATRRTTWTFSVGPTMATAPLVGGSDLRREYRVIADGSWMYEFGRTWRFQGNYHRGLGYIEGFQGPAFTNAYGLSTAGYFGRRVDLTLSASHSTGESALIGAPSQYATYTGDARLRYAVTRMWATYVEYVSVYYAFNRQLEVPTFLPPGLTRNGLRTGIMLRIPVRER
jgi:hypothetical protein